MLRKLSLGILFVCTLIVPAALADPGSPIEISVVDTPDPVASGAQITYTITIANAGGSSLSNVVLTDQLNGVGGIGVPPQLQITSTRGSCTQTTTLVTCSAGNIEGRGPWTVSIRGIVVAPTGTVLNNTATVGGTRSAQSFSSTVTTTTLVAGGSGSPLPDLTISKNGPSSVNVSSPMAYTLTVNNIGSVNASNVRVMDTVPSGLTGLSATGTSLFTCSIAGQTVTCVGGSVNQGSNATITINATSPGAPVVITNTAVVDPDDTIAEGNELNNTSALVNTQVIAGTPLPEMTINLTDNPDPVVPGALLTFKTLVQNPTSQRADDVMIVLGTQGLVASAIQVNQVITNGTQGSDGGCSVVASETRCRVRTLNAGGSVLVTVTGSVIASAGSTLLTTGTLTWNIRNKGSSLTDTEITTVKPDVDLTVTKSDSPDPVCASSWPGLVPPAPAVCRGGLTYTIVVGNSGINAANNVLIRDPLPAGTFFDSFVAPAFAGGCSVDGSNVLTCTGGTVAPESTTTVTIVLVAPPGTGTILNTVTVDPNNAIFEADETNNTATSSTMVITGIDLTIDKVDSAPGFDPIATNGTQTYTITVDNLGTQNATNIRVRDTLPADTRFRSVVADNGFTCSHSGGVVECFGGSIRGTAAEFYPPFGAPGNDTATITIRIFAQPIIGTMHNEVRVDPLGEIAEANETNNFEFEDTVVVSGGAVIGAFNQFTISKSQISPANPVARNAKVTYTIVVGNDGSDPALNVTVRDFLPAGSSYIESTGTNSFNCNQVGGHINCVGGQIAPGGSATITISAFAPDTPGTYTNQAIVDPDGAVPEGNEFDNQAFAQTIVTNGGNGPFYELSVTKTQTSPLNDVARNAVVTYAIAVTNGGSDPVIGVRVRDMLPAGSRYIQATGTNQFLCTHVNGIVECLGGQMLAGATATITVTTFAPDTPGTYTNQALVDPENTIPEGDELNNQAQVNTIVANGGNGPFNDLKILKTGTAATTPNGAIQYTLVVSNIGSNAALNVGVRDVLPAGTTFVSAADTIPAPGAAFTCSHSGGVVTCTGATINPGAGAARTIGISVTAPNVQTSLLNTAVVDPDNLVAEGDEFNNTSSAATAVTSAINLTVSKSGPMTATQSSVTDYTIKVKNNKIGPTGQNALGVVMVDPLPVGLIPLAVDAGSGNNFACQIMQNPINGFSCVGDLAPDDEVTIKITVFVTAESGRSLDNTACVDPSNTITESNELDNCSSVGTFVAPAVKQSPDLLVSKQVDSLATTPGSVLTYTITISNNGDAKAASPVTVSDSLPSQVSFINFTTTNGFTCTEAAGTVTCQDGGSGLNPSASAQITILASVNSGAAVPIANTASAAPALVDTGACSDPMTCENETLVNLENNTSTVITGVGSSGLDLVISSVTDIPDPVAAGQGLKYTIVAVNGGTAVANNVHISVNIPSSGVTFVNADGSNGFNCALPVANVIDCVGNLPGGGSTTITVNFVTLLAGLPPDVSLTATIDPADLFAETNEGNNTKTQTTTISPLGTCSSCVDLVASQLLASPEPVSPGGAVTVTFQVANVGDTPSTLAGPVPLLTLTAITDLTVTAGTPTSSDPAIACVLVPPALPFVRTASCTGNIAPGQGVTITWSLPTVTGTELLVFGSADPSFLQFESNEVNNDLTQTVVVGP